MFLMFLPTIEGDGLFLDRERFSGTFFQSEGDEDSALNTITSDFVFRKSCYGLLYQFLSVLSDFSREPHEGCTGRVPVDVQGVDKLFPAKTERSGKID